MADTKVSALTAATAISSDDYVYMVDDPGGTPTSKKITFDNLQKSITNVTGSLSTGLLKVTTTTGELSTASSGTDYAPATSGSAILKGNGSGGFSSASAGTDYAEVGANTSITSVNLDQAGLVVKGATSFGLNIKPNETYTAQRTLNIVTGNASRFLTMNGDATISGTNTGDQTITLTGDATGSGTGSFATTIASDAVTNAKMANMATQTIKGRTTAGTGDPEDLTATQATEILNAFTGDSGAGGVKGLVPAPSAGDAAASKFLKADGTWSAPSGSGDVVGPASATDNAVARFDGTTGKLIQNSAVTIADTSGDITAGKYNTVAISGASTPTLAVTGTSSISGANTGDQNLFSTIAVSGQSNVVADAASDTLTLVAGTNVTITTDASTDSITIAASGSGGGTKTYSVFNALNNQPLASNYATLDTRNNIPVLDFDDTTEESAVFLGIIPEAASLGSGLIVKIHWTATSATSGDCRWGAQIQRNTTDLDSDSFDTATEGTSTTNGTSGIITVTSLTLTNIDSVAAGDSFRLKIYRDVTDAADTMAGDAELVAVEVRSAA